jgi:hypothetical protein
MLLVLLPLAVPAGLLAATIPPQKADASERLR